jgi:hypothetical protein
MSGKKYTGDPAFKAEMERLAAERKAKLTEEEKAKISQTIYGQTFPPELDGKTHIEGSKSKGFSK